MHQTPDLNGLSSGCPQYVCTGYASLDSATRAVRYALCHAISTTCPPAPGTCTQMHEKSSETPHVYRIAVRNAADAAITAARLIGFNRRRALACSGPV